MYITVSIKHKDPLGKTIKGFNEAKEIGIGVLWIALHPNYDKVAFINYITLCLDSCN